MAFASFRPRHPPYFAIELYQNEDGSVTIPTVLRPYMHNQDRIG